MSVILGKFSYLHVLPLPDEKPVDVAGKTEGEDDVEDGGHDRKCQVDVVTTGRSPEDVDDAVGQPESLPDVDDRWHVEDPVGRCHFQLVLFQIEFIGKAPRSVNEQTYRPEEN